MSIAACERPRPPLVDAMLALRDGLARWLVARGVQQWRPGELTAERLRGLVHAGHVHVLRDHGLVVATVAVLWQDPLIWDPRHSPQAISIC